MRTRLYVEGDKSLRAGFSKFFTKAGVRVDVIMTKSAPSRTLEKAGKANPGARNLLLKDSDGPVGGNLEDSVFWMVQVMEAWFLADPAALSRYYGKDFRPDALKPNPKVEEIPKKDVIASLNAATKETSKGRYDKTAHAPFILERIDPAKVRKAAPHCERLFAAVVSG